MMSSSQFYGAGEFLDKRRGLLPNASWTHGIIFCPVSPYQIISREDSIFDYHLVTDEVQAEIAGRVFDNVLPVGLPFAHAFDTFYHSLKIQDIRRLFLSSHTISGEKKPSLQGLFELARGFECDAIILPGNQFESAFGSVVNEATYSDLRVFRGAFPKDLGSYKRIISLFSRTKTLVTDCVGSHIYYATVCDCEIECELTEITESVIHEKLRAVSIGLKEPWLSSMQEHFLDYKRTERIVREFLECSPEVKRELALERIGYKFISNLEEAKNKVHNTALPTLLTKNLNMLLVKIGARWS